MVRWNNRKEGIAMIKFNFKLSINEQSNRKTYLEQNIYNQLNRTSCFQNSKDKKFKQSSFGVFCNRIVL